MNETVLTGEFAHETNSFVRELTKRSDFQERREYFGKDVPTQMSGTGTSIGGIIDSAADTEIDLLHTVSAFATPSGVVSEDAYLFYQSLILDELRDNVNEVDGVVLALHGAMVTEAAPDGEGPLLSAVRSIVGPDIPVVATLDLHANVTEEMVEAADALVAYEEYPHLDKAETGVKAFDILVRAMRGEVEPTSHFERPPTIIFQPKAHTTHGPITKVMERAREHEQRDSVLKANVLPGFYHADIPEMGVTTPVVTDSDPELAREVSQDLAELVWENREEFIGEYPKPAEAVAQAKRVIGDIDGDDGPVVMAEFGSNPGGGGASNGTTVLREMLDQGAENAGWAIMYDPEAVDECLEAGVGNRVTTTIGGKSDDRHGDPIEDVDGYVKAITDGRYVNTGTSHSGQGIQNDIGTTVRFQCGRDDSVTVVLSRTRASAFDAEIWRHVGQPPERLSMICIPSLIAFLGDYEPMSSEVILIDTPGTSAVNPARFEYSRIPRPIFPLDDLEDHAYPDWE